METIRYLNELLNTLIRAYSTLNEKENATSQNSNTDDPDFLKFILRQGHLAFKHKSIQSKNAPKCSLKRLFKNTHKLNNQQVFKDSEERLQDSRNALFSTGARMRRSLGHHLLQPQILKLLLLMKPADFDAQNSLLGIEQTAPADPNP